MRLAAEKLGSVTTPPCSASPTPWPPPCPPAFLEGPRRLQRLSYVSRCVGTKQEHGGPPLTICRMAARSPGPGSILATRMLVVCSPTPNRFSDSVICCSHAARSAGSDVAATPCTTIVSRSSSRTCCTPPPSGASLCEAIYETRRPGHGGPKGGRRGAPPPSMHPTVRTRGLWTRSSGLQPGPCNSCQKNHFATVHVGTRAGGTRFRPALGLAPHGNGNRHSRAGLWMTRVPCLDSP